MRTLFEQNFKSRRKGERKRVQLRPSIHSRDTKLKQTKAISVKEQVTRNTEDHIMELNGRYKLLIIYCCLLLLYKLYNLLYKLLIIMLNTKKQIVPSKPVLGDLNVEDARVALSGGTMVQNPVSLVCCANGDPESDPLIINISHGFSPRPVW